ncbi:hypothetical protein ARMGADRAFT_1081932 [Armillaria gallica]|uniref:Uncharacterized protein n=1 Tax=Armillaria gallica TaxID=47427 RepID=A0A2H3DUP4_ARMGA|nr:hypothetical protein ARMGADRAFT_1081932 [Armillaria gallica]
MNDDLSLGPRDLDIVFADDATGRSKFGWRESPDANLPVSTVTFASTECHMVVVDVPRIAPLLVWIAIRRGKDNQDGFITFQQLGHNNGTTQQIAPALAPTPFGWLPIPRPSHIRHRHRHHSPWASLSHSISVALSLVPALIQNHKSIVKADLTCVSFSKFRSPAQTFPMYTVASVPSLDNQIDGRKSGTPTRFRTESRMSMRYHEQHLIPGGTRPRYTPLPEDATG